MKKKSRLLRSLQCLLPVSALLITALVALSSTSLYDSNKADYYLPKHYQGEVAIIYGCSTCANPQVQNGRPRLVIPDSGILLTKMTYKAGHPEEHFFMKNNAGTYTAVEPYMWQTDTSKKYIFFERVMNFGYAKDSLNYYVTFFYVGKKLDSASDKSRALFEDRVNELIKKNRDRIKGARD